MCIQRQASDQAVERTSRAERATLDYMRVNHARAHVEMAEKCRHFVGTHGLGMSLAINRKMSHITGRKADLLRKIRRLGHSITMMGGIKKQIARILDKNSFRHIFSSTPDFLDQ